MNKPSQKYLRTLTLVFHVNSKKLKTTYVMRNLQSFVIKEDIFQHHRQKMLLRGGTKHGDYGFVE